MALRAGARLLGLLLVAGAAGLPPDARAQVYCCDGEDGRQICADVLPRQCYGKAYRILSPQGSVLEEVGAPLTREQMLQKRDDERRKRLEQDKLRAEKLRERALLETYRNLEDIDRIEARAVADVEADLVKARKLESDLLLEKERLDREKEFYATAPMPDDLARAVSDNLQEIIAQRTVIDSKKDLIKAIHERYAADREAYKVIMERREALLRR
ncbi:MAG: hypothetical protein KDG55_07145 [Rhodocyclaceae bacterium]|nr:hypothetical protein [Rhodocyclaceae bacterium]